MEVLQTARIVSQYSGGVMRKLIGWEWFVA
jgi:hypothetical protein